MSLERGLGSSDRLAPTIVLEASALSLATFKPRAGHSYKHNQALGIQLITQTTPGLDRNGYIHIYLFIYTYIYIFSLSKKFEVMMY